MGRQEGRVHMRVTRNYLNGLLSGNNGIGGTDSLLQRALSRSSKSRKTNRTSLLLNSTNNRSKLLTQNVGSAMQSQKLYYNMKYHSGQVQEYAEKLLDSADDSVFAKAEESGDTSQIVAGIKGFVSQYNAMLQNLRDSDKRTDDQLLTQLNNASRVHSSDLRSCGVARNSDGTLSIDDKALSETDIDTLKKVWNSQGSFAGRAAIWADSVQSAAERNMDAEASSAYSSLFKNYGNSGNYFNFFR